MNFRYITGRLVTLYIFRISSFVVSSIQIDTDCRDTLYIVILCSIQLCMYFAYCSLLKSGCMNMVTFGLVKTSSANFLNKKTVANIFVKLNMNTLYCYIFSHWLSYCSIGYSMKSLSFRQLARFIFTH